MTTEPMAVETHPVAKTCSRLEVKSKVGVKLLRGLGRRRFERGEEARAANSMKP